MSEKAKILFVDDEKQFVDSMCQLLTLEGFDVEPAYSGEMALDIFKSRKFDLLITDLSMPGMDGIEFIREIRRMKPRQRIVIVTAFPSQRSQEQAYKLGTMHYIAKPFKTERLLELVGNAVSEREEGLLGAVRLSTTDLVQLYSVTCSTVVLEIMQGKDNGDAGRIFFEKGLVVHAETSKCRGRKAFYEMQSWRSGVFKVHALNRNIPHSIDESVDVLLLEGAQIEDERRVDSHKGTKRKTQDR